MADTLTTKSLESEVRPPAATEGLTYRDRVLGIEGGYYPSRKTLDNYNDIMVHVMTSVDKATKNRRDQARQVIIGQFESMLQHFGAKAETDAKIIIDYIADPEFQGILQESLRRNMNWEDETLVLRTPKLEEMPPVVKDEYDGLANIHTTEGLVSRLQANAAQREPQKRIVFVDDNKRAWQVNLTSDPKKFAVKELSDADYPITLTFNSDQLFRASRGSFSEETSGAVWQRHEKETGEPSPAKMELLKPEGAKTEVSSTSGADSVVTGEVIPPAAGEGLTIETDNDLETIAATNTEERVGEEPTDQTSTADSGIIKKPIEVTPPVEGGTGAATAPQEESLDRAKAAVATSPETKAVDDKPKSDAPVAAPPAKKESRGIKNLFGLLGKKNMKSKDLSEIVLDDEGQQAA